MKQMIALITITLFLIPLTTSAQDFCEGNFDYDHDVDGTDAFTFKTDFGRSLLKNPCPPDGPAPVPRTGQIESFYLFDDGELEKGVEWPVPRFTDNLDGTVTDNLTGLIWLKNADCFGPRTWFDALSDCNVLSSGNCGLTDGSIPGDWRSPHIKELQSLIDYNNAWPSLPSGHPFINVQSGYYWQSTTCAYHSNIAWFVGMDLGDVLKDDKSIPLYVWPVRGGH
jgi:hypothetical protein